MGQRPFVIIATCLIVMTTVFTLLSLTLPPEVAAEDEAPNGRQDVTATPEFPAEWFHGGRVQAHDQLQGQPAPALTVDGWIGAPQFPVSLEGRVVVIIFFSVDSPVCLSALTALNDLRRAHASSSVVCIGVHESNEHAARMGEVLAAREITFSCAVDIDGSSFTRWHARWSPTCAVIDQAGALRAIGMHPNHVADVVKQLLTTSSATSDDR